MPPIQFSSNTSPTVPTSLLIIPSDISSITHLSLVLPTDNEEDNIQRLIYILSSLLDQILPGKYELIIVEDNSPDLTWQGLSRLLRKNFINQAFHTES
ncbi:MAG: glycosyltransferase [Limnothrix sp. RL_2_0]|nr:glycosyltransferase [Limnothrix sp. RL_2_0]